MNMNRYPLCQNAEPGPEAEGVAALALGSPSYLPGPPLAEVLREQVDFLLTHAGHNVRGCADCLRARKLLRILMRPFE